MEVFWIIGFLWNFVGMFILGMTANKNEWFSVWRLNPIEIYKRCKVNYFGTVVLMLLSNLICPVVSIYYWLYKLCTVGRK